MAHPRLVTLSDHSGGFQPIRTGAGQHDVITKPTGRTHMNPPRPTTPADRDRALRLRRRVTTAVGAGSVGAIAVFGVLAAGHASGVATVAGTTTTSATSTAAASSTSASATTSSPTIAAATAAPTATSTPTAQAVTGGS
jgi:hypothetical protein